MNHLLIEIGIHDLAEDYIGTTKRMILEEMTKAFIEKEVFVQDFKVEATLSRFIVYSDDVQFNEDLDIVTLLKDFIPEVLGQITLPIYIEDKNASTQFLDYITWIQCVFNGEIITFEKEFNEYLEKPEIPFDISNYDEYKKKLKDESVLIEQEERINFLRSRSLRLVREYGWEIDSTSPIIYKFSERLNYPIPEMGSFDEKYLILDETILYTCLTEDFNCLPIYNENEKLVPNFITAREKYDSNYQIESLQEKINHRLEEILNLYTEDQEVDFEELVLDLKTLDYLEDFGSYYDKTIRVVEISTLLADHLDVGEKTLADAKRIAYLSNADLTTKMVQEFPHLKGVIGMIYSFSSGEKELVSQGIREHYQPNHYGDFLPEHTATRIVSVASKLEFLISFFLKYGHNPLEGSMRSRRAATGIILTIIESGWTLDMSSFLRDALYIFMKSFDIVFDYDKLYGELSNFIKSKLRDELIRENFKFYIIDGVLSSTNFDIFDIYEKTKSLARINKETENQFISFVNRICQYVNSQEKDKEINTKKHYKVQSFLNYYTEQRKYYIFMMILWDIRDLIYEKLDIAENDNQSIEYYELRELCKELGKIFTLKDMVLF